jgi:2-C-methyl-D-erythritol 4-phosphate cytidylyltransferase
MTAAIIVAAGRGERLGGEMPKGLRPLGGQPLYRYSLDAASACDSVDRIVLVIPEGREQLVQAELEARQPHSPVSLVTGGGTRQESVLRGLGSLPEEVTWVAVHDAARPLASSTLFARVIACAREYGGAIAAVRATDTIKRKAPGQILRTLPRQELWQAQTPQVFKRAELQSALQNCLGTGATVTDEAEAMEQSGFDVALLENHEPNLKIATAADLRAVELLLSPSS